FSERRLSAVAEGGFIPPETFNEELAGARTPMRFPSGGSPLSPRADSFRPRRSMRSWPERGRQCVFRAEALRCRRGRIHSARDVPLGAGRSEAATGETSDRVGSAGGGGRG